MTEAFLAGRRGIGFDIDPLALILSKAKVTLLDTRQIVQIGRSILNQAEFAASEQRSELERIFEVITKGFLEQAFALLRHLRPGDWYYSTQAPISDFDQYEHLANLERIVKQDNELASALGKDDIIMPDIVISRGPVSDEEINRETAVVSVAGSLSRFTLLRKANYEHPRPIPHASISCKWTLGSGRGQNARTKALNLIRNRKGHLPHVVAVTAEPLPTRIASLALGTGDLDCVYHFALPELQESISEIENEDQMDMLMILIDGRRLRDISDLPFDLAM